MSGAEQFGSCVVGVPGCLFRGVSRVVPLGVPSGVLLAALLGPPRLGEPLGVLLVVLLGVLLDVALAGLLNMSFDVSVPDG